MCLYAAFVDLSKDINTGPSLAQMHVEDCHAWAAF